MINSYFDQESERLSFRKLTLKDVPIWAEFFENNDSLHFVGVKNTDNDILKLSEHWVKKQLKRYEDEYGLLAAINKQSNQLIGMTGILPRNINGKKEYEVAAAVEKWEDD